MHAKAIVLTAAATGTFAAELNLFPGHAMVRREVVARQTGTATTNDPCVSSLISISNSLPTPAPDLMSALASNTATAICAVTVAPSLSDKFNAYTSTVVSWYSANSAAIKSVLSQCPKYSSLANEIPICSAGKVASGAVASGSVASGSVASGSTSAAASAKTTGTAVATVTGAATAAAAKGTSAASSGARSGAASSALATTTNKAAAPRETGFLAGAVAAAGVIGVVAAL